MDNSDQNLSSSAESSRKTAVDFSKLGKDSLSGYCRAFDLIEVTKSTSKEEMLIAVQSHFDSYKILDEEEVIVKFVQAAAKRSSN